MYLCVEWMGVFWLCVCAHLHVMCMHVGMYVHVCLNAFLHLCVCVFNLLFNEGSLYIFGHLLFFHLCYFFICIISSQLIDSSYLS